MVRRDRKLGVIGEGYSETVDQLISNLLISRVVLIRERDNNITGFYDSYMKVVFIANNCG